MATATRRRLITGSTSAAIASSVEAGVRGGRLPPGTSLPTIRDLADELKVSTATVADAYRTLRQRGVIRTYGRRGTRVAELPPLATTWVPAPPAPGLHNLADGNPDPKLLPPLGRLLAKAGAEHMLYGDPPKLPELVDVGRSALWCRCSPPWPASSTSSPGSPTPPCGSPSAPCCASRTPPRR
jgi:DNA-binding transcriptional MocR family regulator